RSKKVVFNYLPRTAAIIDSGEDARISGSINDPIDRRKVLEIGSISNIAMLKSNPTRTKDAAIGFAPRANEVIDPDYFAPWLSFAKPVCERTTDKTTDSCNEEPHRRE